MTPPSEDCARKTPRSSSGVPAMRACKMESIWLTMLPAGAIGLSSLAIVEGLDAIGSVASLGVVFAGVIGVLWRIGAAGLICAGGGGGAAGAAAGLPSS